MKNIILSNFLSYFIAFIASSYIRASATWVKRKEAKNAPLHYFRE
jgi:hypothetical protein